MAVAFGTISNTTYASRTNTAVTAPASIADGNLLLAFIVTAALGAAPTPTPPAGFTALPGTWPTGWTGGGFDLKIRGYYKIAASESGSYTFTHTTCSSQGIVIRCTGPVDATTPIPQLTINTGITADSTATGLTTTSDGCLILFAQWDNGDTTTNLTAPTGTTPTFTERLDVTLSYIATGNLTPAGATGSKTFANNANTGSPWAAVLLAVAPQNPDATVAAPPLDGVGDIPSPVASSPDGVVFAPAADGTGHVPAPVVSVSQTITVPGSAVAPSSLAVPGSSSGDATVSAAPADGVGDVATPSVVAGSAVTAVTASGIGDVPSPAVSAGATLTTPAATGTGDVVSPEVAAGSTVAAAPASGIGDITAPAVSGGSGAQDATVTAAPASGSGDAPNPTVAAGAMATGAVADGTGDVPSPVVHAGANVGAVPAHGDGDLPSPHVGPGGINPETVETGFQLNIPAFVIPSASIPAFTAPDSTIPAFAVHESTIPAFLVADVELITA